MKTTLYILGIASLVFVIICLILGCPFKYTLGWIQGSVALLTIPKLISR